MKKRKKRFFKQINRALFLLYWYTAKSCQPYWSSNKVKGIIRWWRALCHQSYIWWSIKLLQSAWTLQRLAWGILCDGSVTAVMGEKNPRKLDENIKMFSLVAKFLWKIVFWSIYLPFQNICFVSGRAIQMWFYTNGTHLEVSLCRAGS